MHTARTLGLLAASTTALALAPGAASAASLTGVDTQNRLVSFSSSSPASVKRKAITGLPAGEKIVGLDRRPADGRLYALGTTSRFYVVDAASGAATAVGGSPFMPALFGNGFGWDFNPVVDRIRLTSTFAQNLRLHPDTGAVAATDKALAYAAGDANAGKVPTIAASAYTDNVAGTKTTRLLDIDTTANVLAVQDPPNDGGLKTIGKLGIGDVTNPASFDISAAGQAFAALKVSRRVGTRLYFVNVATGKATSIGRIGPARSPITLTGLTVLK